MRILPLPLEKIPPPASLTVLLLMVLLLMVSVQAASAKSHMHTLRPSSSAELLVTTMLFRVTLTARIAERRVTTPVGGMRMSAKLLTLKTAGARRLSSSSRCKYLGRERVRATTGFPWRDGAAKTRRKTRMTGLLMV